MLAADEDHEPDDDAVTVETLKRDSRPRECLKEFFDYGSRYDLGMVAHLIAPPQAPPSSSLPVVKGNAKKRAAASTTTKAVAKASDKDVNYDEMFYLGEWTFELANDDEVSFRF